MLDRNERYSVYPGIEKILRVCKLFLYVPYEINGDMNLKINLLHDYIQHIYWISVHAVILVGRAFEMGEFTNRNPYKILRQFRILFIEMYALFILYKAKTEYRSITRVFGYIKGIDGEIRLTKNQDMYFSRQVRYRTIQIYLLYIVSVLHGFFNNQEESIMVKMIWIIILGVFVVQPILSDVVLWLLLAICNQYYEVVHEQLKSM